MIIDNSVVDRGKVTSLGQTVTSCLEPSLTTEEQLVAEFTWTEEGAALSTLVHRQIELTDEASCSLMIIRNKFLLLFLV